jgi:hypothetical protein
MISEGSVFMVSKALGSHAYFAVFLSQAAKTPSTGRNWLDHTPSMYYWYCTTPLSIPPSLKMKHFRFPRGRKSASHTSRRRFVCFSATESVECLARPRRSLWCLRNRHRDAQHSPQELAYERFAYRRCLHLSRTLNRACWRAKLQRISQLGV